MPSIRRSLVLSFAQKYTTLLISLPTIMVLSRLLTPAQVGVYSVAVAFVNIVQMLRDFGTSEYLVQVRELDDATARSAFTVTFVIAWALGVALFLCSPLIASFFNEEGLRLVLEVMSINFFLLPFGSTINALLMRSMQFGIRYRIATTAQLAQSAVTLTLAWLGYGYMSPAWGSVAGMVVNVLGCLSWGRDYRIRGVGLAHWRPVASFGVQKTFGSIVNRVGMSAPDFIIGRMLGFAEAGLFSRGNGLVRMFRENIIGAIGSVAFSAFSQRHRDDERPGDLFLKSITFVTCISWPFFAFSALMAFPVMRIMFGDQWDATVPILQFLAIAGLINTSLSHNSELLTATGRIGVATTRITVLQSVRVAAMIAAAFYSLNAVAAVQVPVALFGFVYTANALVRYSGITWRDLFRALAPTIPVTIATMIIPALVYLLDTPSGDNLWSPLLGSMAGAAFGWLLGIWLAKHPVWFELRDFLSVRLNARLGRA
ncbi:polysaccharide biosynthesis protein [Salinisphaera orenii YIM 95161]|uniref:Polysaccharide biosynthesis protein n=2 Tax=Salinisphaera TaxID=180541 RepID=A0A423Q320_9GAMM|nr:polysaccharide biosynthesis protein [Salinisphaera halophila YIM 95161]